MNRTFTCVCAAFLGAWIVPMKAGGSIEEWMPLSFTCPMCGGSNVAPDGWWSRNWTLATFTTISVDDQSGTSVGYAIINVGRKTASNKVPVKIYVFKFLDMSECIAVNSLYPINDDGNVEVWKNSKGVGPVDLTITPSGDVSGTIGGYLVGVQEEREAFVNGSHLFELEVGGYSLNAAYKLVEDAIPETTTVSVSKKAWYCGRAPTIKYKKNKATGAFELVGLENTEYPNILNLKLKFDARKHVFKGSFRVYATNAGSIVPGKKPKLKKYTFTISGKVENGVGSGFATCKALKASWPVTIE